MISFVSKKFVENKCKRRKFENGCNDDMVDFCDDIVTQEPRSLSGMDDLEQELLSMIVNTLARMFSMDDFVLLGYGEERFCQVILDGYAQVMVRFPIQGISISIFSTDMGVTRTMLSCGMDTTELDMGIDLSCVETDEQWLGAVCSIVTSIYPLIADDFLSYTKSDNGCVDGTGDDDVPFSVRTKEPHVRCHACHDDESCDEFRGEYIHKDGGVMIGVVPERCNRSKR